MSTQEMPTPKLAAAPHQAPRGRFYRPELDGLRFFAFLLVLMHHGPGFERPFGSLNGMGGFGLSMFFMLSAYLITELLLREREKTHTVSWKLFFIRRALRIWPLYFVAVAAMVLLSANYQRFYVPRSHEIAMALFVANWVTVSAGLGLYTRHLWSISVEEQFYLIWPPIMKLGGKRAILIASLVLIVVAPIWIVVFSWKGWALWYDTPVQFLFFATGALIAIKTHGGLPQRSGVNRALFLALGVALLVTAFRFGRIGTDNAVGVSLSKSLVGYGLVAAGCGVILFGLLGFSAVPRWLAYLGKISYGLYVFHEAVLHGTMIALSRLHIPKSIYGFVVDGLATLLCIGVAHLSYQYFEKPFLRMKERFAVIPSREA